MNFKRILSFALCGVLTSSFMFNNLSTCFATGDYITKIDVDINNVDNIGRKLYELCNQFNYSHGIHTDDSLSGWAQSAYEYFFKAESGHYNVLPQDKKIIFAQCIEAMHINKDNSVWHEAINTALTLLSSHGGHCNWRAIALIDDVYCFLSTFLSESGIDCDTSDNHEIEA